MVWRIYSTLWFEIYDFFLNNLSQREIKGKSISLSSLGFRYSNDFGKDSSRMRSKFSTKNKIPLNV